MEFRRELFRSHESCRESQVHRRSRHRQVDGKSIGGLRQVVSAAITGRHVRPFHLKGTHHDYRKSIQFRCLPERTARRHSLTAHPGQHLLQQIERASLRERVCTYEYSEEVIMYSKYKHTTK